MRMLAVVRIGAICCILTAPPAAPSAFAAAQDAASASYSCTGSEGVCTFFRSYIAAFNSRDFAAFTSTFAEDISVFFDRPLSPERRDGRTAVEAVFRPGFAYFHPADGRPAPSLPPPLVPTAVRVQEYGDFAIVTFLAGLPDDLARRTVVLRRGKLEGWRVVHIHASSVELPAKPQR